MYFPSTFLSIFLLFKVTTNNLRHNFDFRAPQGFHAHLDKDELKGTTQNMDNYDESEFETFDKALTEYKSIVKNIQYFAYATIFLPNNIETEEQAWQFLEMNADKDCVIDKYAGKATTCVTGDFSVEHYHSSSKRSQSTIFDHVNATGKHAFQILAIKYNTIEEATDQESIFQVSELSLCMHCSKYKARLATYYVSTI